MALQLPIPPSSPRKSKPELFNHALNFKSGKLLVWRGVHPQLRLLPLLGPVPMDPADNMAPVVPATSMEAETTGQVKARLPGWPHLRQRRRAPIPRHRMVQVVPVGVVQATMTVSIVCTNSYPFKPR